MRLSKVEARRKNGDVNPTTMRNYRSGSQQDARQISKSKAMTRHGSPRRKALPASKYRDHDECAVRMREVFVRICMVPGSGPLTGLVCGVGNPSGEANLST